MSLKENLPTYKSLPFQWTAKWSSHLPKVIWDGFDLTPLNSKHSILDLSHLSLGETLNSIQIEMNHLLFLRFCFFLEQEKKNSQAISSLEKTLNWRWNRETRQLLHVIERTSASFQMWVAEKKLMFNDLRPLLRAPIEDLNPYLDKMVQFNPSKSTGQDFLEKLCDLIELNQDNLKVLQKDGDEKAWREKLQALTSPQTTAKDRIRQNTVQSWPWPSRMRGEWKRQGDQAGLKVEIYSYNSQDLREKIENLVKICERWENDL